MFSKMQRSTATSQQQQRQRFPSWVKVIVVIVVVAVIVTIFLIGCQTCWQWWTQQPADNKQRGSDRSTGDDVTSGATTIMVGRDTSISGSGLSDKDKEKFAALYAKALGEHLKELTSPQIEQRMELEEEERDSEDEKRVADLPVDVVYTWVDCSDEKWAAKKRMSYRDFRLQRGEREYEVTVANDDRFSSQLDELRYSMESVAKYMPWVRKIFVVTDDQKPEWLDEVREQYRLDLTVVDHKTIFPQPHHAYLPTFNSVAIETCLHRIPGLSECYVYMNDDLFVCAPVKKSDFFVRSDDGKFVGLHYHVDFMQMLPPREVKINQMPPSLFQLAQLNTLRMLQGDNGARLVVGLSHSPSPALKSFVEHVEAEIPKTLDTNRRLHFRAMEMINFTNNLIPNLSLHRKKVFKLTWSPYNDPMKSSAKQLLETLGSRRTILRTANLTQGLSISHYWESQDLCNELEKLPTIESVKAYAEGKLRDQSRLKFFVINNSPGNFSVNQVNRMRAFIETMIRARQASQGAAPKSQGGGGQQSI